MTRNEGIYIFDEGEVLDQGGPLEACGLYKSSMAWCLNG